MQTEHITRKIASLFDKGVFAGYVFIFFGLATFIFSALFEPYRSHFYVGGTIALLILLFGLLLSFSYRGIALKPQQRLIRNFKSYLGFKVGKWQALPDYERVVIEKVTPKNPSSFKGITPAVRWYQIRYLVILSKEKQAQIVSVKPNQEAAFAEGEALAEALDLSVVDYIKVEA